MPGDPFYNSVSLLLHCDGVNGGTSFPDSSKNNFVPTLVGTPTTSTAQVKFGSASYKGASGSGLHYTADPAFGFGLGEYTIEMWVYIPSAPVVNTSILIDFRDGVGDTAPFLAYNSTLQKMYYRVNGNEFDFDTVISFDAWHHVVISRSINTGIAFLDGVKQTMAIDLSTSNAGSNNYIDVGLGNDQAIPFTGFLDEVRVTKGIARYTADFSVTSQPFPNLFEIVAPASLALGITFFSMSRRPHRDRN